MAAFLGVSRKREDGEVTAMTGSWWCMWPCWHGDVGPALRPEVHHHNLEETGPRKKLEEQREQGTRTGRRQMSSLAQVGGPGAAQEEGWPVYLSLSCGEPVPSSSSSLSSFMPFSL